MKQYIAVVPAAGQGQRMKNQRPKQYLKIKNKTILEYTLERLLNYPLISKVVLVLNPNDCYWQHIQLEHKKLHVCYQGGSERCVSVLKGIETIDPTPRDDDWILVHDGVRPCLKEEDLEKLIFSLENNSIGGLLGIPQSNTLKEVSHREVLGTHLHQKLWQALTPQMFRYQILLNALRKVIKKNQTVSDEAAAVEKLGFSPQIIHGHASNIKLTYPEDLEIISICLLALQFHSLKRR